MAHDRQHEALADGTTVQSKNPAPHPDPLADAATLGAPGPDGAAGQEHSAAHDGAQRLPIGSRFARYVLLSKLGEGGMGEVFSAYDEDLGRRVAVKVVHERHLGDRHSRARIEREALALARLSHPNVVQVYDVGDFGGQVFVAMEYVKGETLRAAQERHDPTTVSGRRAILDMYLQAGRGVAAAHAAGLIHRDFKPDNVLVGDDGRARVFDFGLALADRSTAPDDDGWVTPRSGALDLTLTRTGSVLGTPAYMAPEQFLARPADHRADIFAFAVALYYALYRDMPFDGHTFAARQVAVLAGVPRDAPADSKIPAWLRAVLLRGLAREPDDRYQDMGAFLDALADDPDERRRLRWRQFTFGLAAVVTAWLLGIIGLWGWDRWQQYRAEAKADERLAAALTRIDELLADGADADAERVFADFVASPDNRATAALGRAWLHQAGRARRSGDGAAAIDALASAYAVATSPEDQVAALTDLAALFRDEMRWRDLQVALSTLEQRLAGFAATAEVESLRLDSALGLRDLGGARDRLHASARSAAAPVLAALSSATETPHQHHGRAVPIDLDGDGRPELVFETDGRERQIAQVVRATPTLDPVATVDLGFNTFQALEPAPGSPGLLVTTERNKRVIEAVLRRLEGDHLVELSRWSEGQLRAALAVDVDGDGGRELLVGTGPYSRRLVELVQGTDGSWSTRSLAPTIDRRRSDVVDLIAGDLDADGRTEIVAALGPWSAYELHVLRHDRASDTLRTLTRRRLGNIEGAALVRGGPSDGPEIAVSKTDKYGSTVVFPRDRPYGEPAGTYLFRLVDGALVRTAFIPAPRLTADEVVQDGRPIVGDFDGDGRDEIVITRSVSGARHSILRENTVLLVRDAGGAWVPVILGDIVPLAALDLDGDRDDELIVSMTDDRNRVWVLGSGAATLPPSRLDLPRAAPSLGSPDPVLERMLQRADDLAQMGLLAESADNLSRIAGLVADPGMRTRIELRAAELLDAITADARAAELFARAAEVLPAAHEGAARSFLRLGRVDAAAAHLERAPRDRLVAGLDESMAALRGGSGVDLEFAQPLAPIWRIGQAQALRRDGARETLHVDAIVSDELLSAPLRWTGRSLVLEVDLDLDRIEWGAGLEMGVVREGSGVIDESGPLGIGVTTVGGGDLYEHRIECIHEGTRSYAKIPFSPGDPGERLGRFRIRATYLPELGERSCEVMRGSGELLLYKRVRLDERMSAEPGSRMRLVLASTRSTVAWVEADLRRVRLLGAEFDAPRDAPAEPALVEARRQFVEDDALAALAALRRAAAPTLGDRVLEVVALARLGRLGEAERTLATLLAEQPAVLEIPSPIDALLRTAPEQFGVLLRGAAGPQAARSRLAEAWSFSVLQEHDPRGARVGWSMLAERDLDADGYYVLRVHAASAAMLGHAEKAEASLRAALAALDDPRRRDPDRGPDWTEVEKALVRLDLAALALARGDEAAARAELRDYLVGPEPDLAVAERLRAREDLRALWDLAAD